MPKAPIRRRPSMTSSGMYSSRSIRAASISEQNARSSAKNASPCRRSSSPGSGKGWIRSRRSRPRYSSLAKLGSSHPLSRACSATARACFSSTRDPWSAARGSAMALTSSGEGVCPDSHPLPCGVSVDPRRRRVRPVPPPTALTFGGRPHGSPGKTFDPMRTRNGGRPSNPVRHTPPSTCRESRRPGAEDGRTGAHTCPAPPRGGTILSTACSSLLLCVSRHGM